MSALTGLAFAIFFACCIAQFPLGREVRRILAERHPNEWAEISQKSWFVEGAVQSFANSDRVRELGDPELSRAAQRLKWLQVVAIGCWVLLVVSMMFGAAGSPSCCKR